MLHHTILIKTEYDISERNKVSSQVKYTDIFNFIERDCCPTCGGQDFMNLFEQKFSNGETKNFIDTYYDSEFRKSLGNNIYKLVNVLIVL